MWQAVQKHKCEHKRRGDGAKHSLTGLSIYGTLNSAPVIVSYRHTYLLRGGARKSVCNW